MSNADLNWITNFIRSVADDALRDLYMRGKYRDVILPMIGLRRLDAVPEPTKAAVLVNLPEIPEAEAIDDLVEGDGLDEVAEDVENEEVAA